MLSRRTLVKVGAGLVAFLPTARALAALPEQPKPSEAAQRPAEPFEPRYATGVVVAAKPGEVLLRTTYRGDVTLRLSQASYLWKGEENPRAPIESGDKVHAWGRPRGDTALDVEKMWVNIINLRGGISRVRTDARGAEFQLVDGRQGVYLVRLDDRTFVHDHDRPETTFGRQATRLADGLRLQVIGLQLPNRTVRGTRVLVGS